VGANPLFSTSGALSPDGVLARAGREPAYFIPRCGEDYGTSLRERSEVRSGLGKGGKSIQAQVEAVARPLVEADGLELVDVELVKEGGYRYLRLYIDKEGGVSFDDCERVSRAVDARLDELWPDPPYDFFEVSSPGVERPLKRDADFARYAGHQVQVSTYAPVDGQKLFIGELVGLVDGNVVLRLTRGPNSGKEIALDRRRVARVKLHVEY